MAESTNQFGIPDKYLDIFKASISLINSGKYFEESLRNQLGHIRMKKTAVTFADGQVKVVDINKYLLQQGDKALDHIKKYNNAINQFFVSPKAEDDINDMGYMLSELFNDISYLSITDQNKVKEFVNNLKNKNNG